MPIITPADAHRLVHGVRATSKGEEQKHNIIWARHLQRALTDERTRRLFAHWRWTYGLDDAEAAIHQTMDELGLQHAPLADRIRSLEQHPQLQVALAVLDRRLKMSAPQRALELRHFTIQVLYSWYPAPPRWRANLMSHLLEQFKGHVVGRVLRQPLAAILEPSPIVGGDVKQGKRPYRNGQQSVRDTDWHWGVRCSDPRTRQTVEALAAQYRAQRHAEGVALAPKDESGRADTSLVRDRIDEVERLLNLSVPPEEWPHTFGS
jgi:hypothetical protein